VELGRLTGVRLSKYHVRDSIWQSRTWYFGSALDQISAARWWQAQKIPREGGRGCGGSGGGRPAPPRRLRDAGCRWV